MYRMKTMLTVGFLPIIFLGWLSVSLEAANLDGSLFLYNPRGQNPTVLNGFLVELLDKRTQIKTDASVTDSYGRFSFQGINEGEYSLIVYTTGRYWRQPVHQQPVRAPATLNPIVLPSLTAVIPYVDYATAGRGTYTFKLWVEVPAQTKRSVQRVEYFFNHPTFANKNVQSDSPANDFLITYTGWGCLSNVEITVLWHSGAPPARVEFNMCEALGRRAGDKTTRQR